MCIDHEDSDRAGAPGGLGVNGRDGGEGEKDSRHGDRITRDAHPRKAETTLGSAGLTARATLIRFHVGRHRLLGELRDHLIAIRNVPHRCGDHCGGSLDIFGNDAFIRIEAAVMR